MESRDTSTNEPKKIFWQEQIRNWQNSGLSQKEFCRNRSLALSTFTFWKRKIARSETAQMKFYPVPVPPSRGQGVYSGLQLHIVEKRFAVDIGEDFSETTLRRLISTLEQL